MVTRDDLRRRQANRRKVVALDGAEFPGLDGLYVREMFCGELNRFAERCDDKATFLVQAALLASFTLSDENGNLIFDEGDAAAFDGFTAKEIGAIASASDGLNYATEAAEAEIEGN